MEFTIYTFGDVEIFRAALAGVAMIFSPDEGFFVSNDGIGLGALAGVALLIGLVVILISGVIRQNVQVVELIMVAMLFAIMFVPRFSVNVEDYNGAGIEKVDDVPLGIAFAAGLTSGLARELNIRMGTAFSTVDGYPSGMMTPQALTSPLKLLYSLRYAPDHVKKNAPRLSQNLSNLVAYCLAGRKTYQSDWENQPIASAAVKTTVTLAGSQGGLTMYQSSTMDESALATCADAATAISTDIEVFFSGAAGSPLQRTLTAAAAKNMAATVNIVGGKATVQDVMSDDVQAALAVINTAGTSLAQEYLTTTLVGTFISASFQCAEKSGNPEDWAKCSPYISAATQYNEAGAAAGTFFQRLMFHGMNIVFFIWICLSPVVAVVMLVMGIRGIKLVGSYLLFGAWAVSWYVGASIINFYILKQMQTSLSMLGGFDHMTVEGLAQWQDVLQTELGVAGDMLASVPLIMFAVMSGSVYGVTQLASKFGGREHYDEKVNSPSVEGSAAFMQRNAAINANHLAASGFNQNLGSGPAFEVQATDRVAQETSVAASREASQSYTRTLGQAVDRVYSAGSSRQDRDDFSTSLKASGQTTRAVAADALSEVSNSKSMNEQQRQDVGNTLKGMISGEISIDSGKAAIGKAAALATGVSAKAALSTSYEDSVNNLQSLGFSHDTAQRLASTFRDTKTTQANLADETSHANVQAFSRNFSKTDTVKKDANLSAALSTTERATENASIAESKSQASTWTNRVSPEQMVQRVHASPEASQQLAFAHQQHWSSDEKYRGSYQAGKRLYQGLTNPVARDKAAQLYALEMSDMRNPVGDGRSVRFQDVATSAGLTMGEPMQGPQTDLQSDAFSALHTNASTATAGARSLTADGLPEANKLQTDVESRQHAGGNDANVRGAYRKYQGDTQAAADAQSKQEFNPQPTRTLEPGLLAKPAVFMKNTVVAGGDMIAAGAKALTTDGSAGGTDANVRPSSSQNLSNAKPDIAKDSQPKSGDKK